MACSLVASGLTACGTDNQLERQTRLFAQERLGVGSTSIVGKRSGGPCLVLNVEDPGGVTHRVVLLKEGEPPKFRPLYISQKFKLEEFKEDDDGGCGMYEAGALRASWGGSLEVVGPP